MSETNTIKRPFGELPPSTAVACNPYLPAEQVPAEELHAFYLRGAPQDESLLWRGWLYMEAGLRQPVYFDIAALELAAARQHAVANGTQEEAQKAALGLAFLPAFRDRAANGQPSSETIDRLYADLATMLARHDINDGRRGEIALLALGARAAKTTPGNLLYISTPREGESNLHTVHGQTYNHDAYRLKDGRKVPVEVKLQKGTARGQTKYANPTFPFYLLGFMRSAIQENGLGEIYPELRPGENEVPSAIVHRYLDTLANTMLDEVRAGQPVHDSLFTTLTGKLYSGLHHWQAAHPMPTISELTRPEASATSLSPPNPQPLVGVSVAQLALSILHIMGSFPYKDLHESFSRLMTAHAIVARLAETSESLTEVAGILHGPAREHMEGLDAALTRTRAELRLYLADLGLGSRHQ